MENTKQGAVKEKCSKCSSPDFAVSKDIRKTRYCNKCRNVWLPKSKTEIELDHAKETIVSLRKRIDELELKIKGPSKHRSKKATQSLKGEDLFG